MDLNKTRPDGIDLSDEAVWVYEEALPDLLDDGKLSEPTRNRLKQSVEALIKGLLVTVAVTAGPAVWAEIQGGTYDLPSLLNTAYTVGVASVISYFRTRV